jgi:hypothetical protein
MGCNTYLEELSISRELGKFVGTHERKMKADAVLLFCTAGIMATIKSFSGTRVRGGYEDCAFFSHVLEFKVVML